MELTHVRYFLEVLRTGTVTSAGAALHVSPSAISRAIKVVEAHVGVPLFDRVGRNLVVNAFGRQFAEQAASATRTLDAAVDETRERAGLAHGTIHLAFMRSLGASFVPSVIRAFRAQYPGTNLELSALPPAELVSKVRDGHADLALAVPHLVPDTDIRWTPLFEEELFCTVPLGHPLAQLDTISFAQLARFPLVTLSPDHSIRKLTDDALAAEGLEMRVAFEGPDLATLLGMVSADIGIGLFPRLAWDRPAIAQRKMTHPIARAVHIGSRSATAPSPIARELTATLIKTARSVR